MAMLNSQRVANISISTVSIPFHHTSPYFPMSLIVKSQQSQRLEESYPHSFMILTYFNHVFQSHAFQCLPIFSPHVPMSSNQRQRHPPNPRPRALSAVPGRCPTSFAAPLLDGDPRWGWPALRVSYCTLYIVWIINYLYSPYIYAYIYIVYLSICTIICLQFYISIDMYHYLYK